MFIDAGDPVLWRASVPGSVLKTAEAAGSRKILRPRVTPLAYPCQNVTDRSRGEPDLLFRRNSERATIRSFCCSRTHLDCAGEVDPGQPTYPRNAPFPSSNVRRRLAVSTPDWTYALSAHALLDRFVIAIPLRKSTAVNRCRSHLA